ncbi:Cytochrome P450 72A14 [Cytospora mali]|uniref:Cytochrome P450 72A14 n=1 Tax=Cytospora mali TaxID=578113 RepID=A0A194VM79_CYTMA|nr:Cytochrome P450 72A14 [Valsa mali]
MDNFFSKPMKIVTLAAASDAFLLNVAWRKWGPSSYTPSQLHGYLIFFWLSWWLHVWGWAFFRLIVKPKSRTIKHNGVFRFLGLFNCERIVVCAPEGLAEVLTRVNDFIQPIHLSFIAQQVLGPGVVLVNGEEHKRQRRLLLPSFAMKHIRAQQPIYWSKAVEATEKLMSHVSDTANPHSDSFSDRIEIGELAGYTALDVISKAALGVDFEAIANPDSHLIQNYRTVFEPTRMFQIFSVLKFIIPPKVVDRLPVKHNTEVRNAAKVVRDVCRTTLREKRERYRLGDLHDSDIISALIRDRNKELEEDDVVTQMMTMLGAGHETVSVAMTWAMYELCRNPDWQAKLRAEVRTKLPSPRAAGRVPQAEDLEIENMPLLNAFCHEVIRYWPPIPMIMRTAANDTTIMGNFVPATTKVILSVTGINRSPDLWGPDGSRFNPNRWYDEEKDKYDSTGGANTKYAHMSFIHGGRDCLGRNFAKAEMLTVIACWVGRFEWNLSDERDMDERRVPLSGGSFSSKPLHGVWCKAKAVPGW